MFILLEKVFKQDWWRIINQFRNTFKFSDNDINKKPLKGIDMLLMVEKDVRGRIYHSVIRYVKSNKKYIKTKDKRLWYIMIKTKNHHMLSIGM